MMVST